MERRRDGETKRLRDGGTKRLRDGETEISPDLDRFAKGVFFIFKTAYSPMINNQLILWQWEPTLKQKSEFQVLLTSNKLFPCKDMTKDVFWQVYFYVLQQRPE
jgi:hypothetical protein